MKGKFFVFLFVLVFLISGVFACEVNYCEHSNGECVLLGDTYDAQYCDFDLSLKDKLDKGASCLNDFECSTESCVAGLCNNKYDVIVSSDRISFFDKIIGFFNGDDPEVTADDDDDDGTPPSGGSCFPAGTKVLMQDGSEKNIEDVVVGDSVISYNEDNDEINVGEVLELESPVRDHLCRILYNNGELLLTSEHPIFTDEGWKSIDPSETKKENENLNVGKLVEGNNIVLIDGIAEVFDINCWDEVVQTYNLKSILTYNNFYADNVLVHNKGSTSSTSCVSVYVCGEWSNSLESCGTRVCEDTMCSGLNRTESSECPGVEAFCGDSSCDLGEDCSNCEVDCGSCEYCGDDICSDVEDFENCPDDCEDASFNYWKAFFIFLMILIVALFVVVFFIFLSKRKKASDFNGVLNNTSKVSLKPATRPFPVSPKSNSTVYPKYAAKTPLANKNRDL